MVDVNVGEAPNDGEGDPLRTAFIKLNANITAIERGVYGRIALRRAASSIPLYFDPANALGGGARAVYIPRTLYLDAPGFVSNFPVTITNSVAAEIAGYAKLMPPSTEAYTIYYLPLSLIHI